MVNSENFSEHINTAYQKISNLPTSEIKYYLYILVTSIKETNNAKTQLFLTELLSLLGSLQKLHQLHNLNQSELNHLFDNIRQHYTRLGAIAATNNLGAQTQSYLLHAAGATLALLAGIFGGILGGLAGFARGIIHLKPFTGFGVGVLSGILLGGSLGFRTPKKLFKNELQRQSKFGLDGLSESLNELPKECTTSSLFNSKVRPISEYTQEVTAEIKKLFETELEFEQFLKATQDYQINTLVSTFIGEPMLAGYIGHHAYIKINIKSAQYLLEFAPEPSDLSNPPSQSEQRTVSGAALIEMLACHRKLQETHPCNARYMLTKAKPGDTDCLSYVNKVLLCTNQEATKVKRFTEMTPVGQVLGACFSKLSPFAPDFFQRGKVFEREGEEFETASSIRTMG